MKHKKILYTPLVVLFLSSCSPDSEPVKETTFYKKENVTTKQLKLSIEASGVIEQSPQLKLNRKLLEKFCF